jgi:hypothetical protein
MTGSDMPEPIDRRSEPAQQKVRWVAIHLHQGRRWVTRPLPTRCLFIERKGGGATCGLR